MTLPPHLRRPSRRSGSFLGVPYDFRRPSVRRVARSLWNPRDPSLFVPQPVGAGWTVNLAAAKRRLRSAR